MAAFNTQKSKIISDINVTPLVDITLVLLIVFMVTAKVIVSQAMPLDLPAAAKTSSVQLIFSVELRADGELKVDGKQIAEVDEVLALAQQSARDNKELRAVIRAEQDVRHGRVIEVMDLLKRAGITRIAFGVVPKRTEQQEPTG